MTDHLKPEYRLVRFRCEQTELPNSFFIVTAYNPNGETMEPPTTPSHLFFEYLPVLL